MFNKLFRSKEFQLIGLILLFSLLVVACGSQQTDPPITDKDWEWSEMVETEPASQSLVPNPENYLLRLAPDGSLSIKADCNMAGGSYTLDNGVLSIELGPSTMAYCGEESLDQLFLGFLSSVESSSIQDGQLLLELKNGAGQMTFNEG